jgi:hypothetical protein
VLSFYRGVGGIGEVVIRVVRPALMAYNIDGQAVLLGVKEGGLWRGS